MAKTEKKEIMEEKKSYAMNKLEEYIMDLQKEGKPFDNASTAFEKLKKNDAKFDISKSTFTRILTKGLRYRWTPNGYVAGNNTDRDFKDCIQRLSYNKFLCYRVKEVALGSFLANTINKHFEEGDSFHCVAINDMLLCFYNENRWKEKVIINKIKRLKNRMYLGVPE